MQRMPQRVSEWYENNALLDLFTLGTKSPLSIGHVSTWYLFEHIYCPIRLPTATGQPSDWTFYDVGYSWKELTQIFWSRYSGNFLQEHFDTATAFRTAATSGTSIVENKFEAVVRANIYKYLKMMELHGYTYNPLYNVDGTEIYASADLHGDETQTSEYDSTRTHSVSTYNGDTTTEYTDNNKSGTGGDTLTTTHAGTGHGAAASDNPFGEAVSDADMYHVDKRIRQGNIGVTKSTELLADQVALLRAGTMSIINEFMHDLAKSIIIPVY